MKRPAVIFDLDDTLYPSTQFIEGGIVAASKILRQLNNLSVDPEPLLMKILHKDGPFYLFDRGFVELGLERTPELMSSLVSAFRYHEPDLSPYPGVVEMISDLRERGVTTGLVTDGPADVQRRKWTSLGIDDLFDAVIFCRDVNGMDRPKPDPIPFRAAASRLGNPWPCIFVGDNPTSDFPAPDAFGWDTVRVCWPGASHISDGDFRSERRIVSDIESLKTTLFQMTGLARPVS